jgi:hypothetical protein
MLRDDFTQEGFVVRGECTAAHGVRVGNRSRYCRLRERPVAGLGALLLIYYRRASSWVSEMKNRPVGRPASTPSRLTSLPAASRAQDTIAERLARERMHPQRRLQYRRAHVRGHRARPSSAPRLLRSAQARPPAGLATRVARRPRGPSHGRREARTRAEPRTPPLSASSRDEALEKLDELKRRRRGGRPQPPGSASASSASTRPAAPSRSEAST